VIERDLRHRLAEALLQDKSMREAAVARAEPPRGGERRQLVAAQVHPLLDCAVQRNPRRVDLGPVGERALVIRRHAGIVHRSACMSLEASRVRRATWHCHQENGACCPFSTSF